MSTQVQYRRGSATENNAFTGALGEITVDTTNATLRVHNGITLGGSNIATVAYVTSQISSLSADSISNGTSNVKVISSGGNVAVTVGGSGIFTVASTGVFTTGLASVTGNITGGNLSVGTGTITVNNIVNGGSNSVGNIGSSSTYFNTVFAKATSAQYADLAENYIADKDYPIGTVLRIGGMYEVSHSNKYHCSDIAGTVSDKPAYIMNAGLQAEHVVAVALLGRVPCRVIGDISKGDLLVSSTVHGVASVLDPELWVPGCVVGKALEDYSSESEGVIEILVGRL